MRDILENHPNDDKFRVILLLGELSHTSHIMKAAPFSYKSRQPKETQIYKFDKESVTRSWTPTFLGTYTSKNFVASKTPQTRPRPDVLSSRMPNHPDDHKRQEVNDRESGLTTRQLRDYEEMRDDYIDGYSQFHLTNISDENYQEARAGVL